MSTIHCAIAMAVKEQPLLPTDPVTYSRNIKDSKFNAAPPPYPKLGRRTHSGAMVQQNPTDDGRCKTIELEAVCPNKTCSYRHTRLIVCIGTVSLVRSFPEIGEPGRVSDVARCFERNYGHAPVQTSKNSPKWVLCHRWFLPL